MTKETANRLASYRKNASLSQEELADKIGVSRQTVSKWERGEASPDTDNLISLAKLYGVTLDALINADPEPCQSSTGCKKRSVHIDIGDNGIFVNSDDGSHDSMHIEDDNIYVSGDDGETIIHEKKFRNVTKEFSLKPRIADIPLFLIATIAYLLLGFQLNMWDTGWLVYVYAIVLHGFINAFTKRDVDEAPITMTVAATYLTLGCFFGLWHPWWILFLCIPIIKWLLNAITK